jgi:hypothetical protein
MIEAGTTINVSGVHGVFQIIAAICFLTGIIATAVANPRPARWWTVALIALFAGLLFWVLTGIIT